MTNDEKISELIHNNLISEDSSKNIISAALSRIWNNSSQSGLSISKKDLLEIKSSQKIAHELIDRYFHIITDTAESRRENLTKHAEKKYISIGEDCFPRTLLTRWGIKSPAKLGEKSYPFDLAIHPLPSIVKLLQTKFDDYLNPGILIFDDKKNICINPKLNIFFNHEKGRDYCENNFSKLINTYQRRIENFHETLELDRHITFVLHIRHPSQSDDFHIRGLFTEISKRRGRLPFDLRIINTFSSQNITTPVIDSQIINTSITKLDISYPFNNYIWYNELHASSELGFEFEKLIISHLFQ